MLINQRWASTSLDPMMIFLSSKWAFIPLYIVFLGLFIKQFGKKFWIPTLLTLSSFGLADSISSRICKPLFARVRPAWEESLHPRTPNGLPGSKYGFVSSHSANAFAVFSTAMMLLGLGRRWLKAQTMETRPRKSSLKSSHRPSAFPNLREALPPHRNRSCPPANGLSVKCPRCRR